MGEAKRRGVHGGYFGERAPLMFIKAWFAAADHAAIEFTDRQMGDGLWIVLATIGEVSVLLTPDQARGIAVEFEVRLDNPDVGPIVGPMSDLVVALRAAADEVERLHPRTPPAAPAPRSDPRTPPSGVAIGPAGMGIPISAESSAGSGDPARV